MNNLCIGRSVGDYLFIGMRQPQGVQSSQSFTIKIRNLHSQFRSERKGKSRLFYIVVLWDRNQGNVPIMPNYVNIAWESTTATATFCNGFYLFIFQLNYKNGCRGHQVAVVLCGGEEARARQRLVALAINWVALARTLELYFFLSNEILK